jgi:hypothetical protein
LGTYKKKQFKMFVDTVEAIAALSPCLILKGLDGLYMASQLHSTHGWKNKDGL